MKHINRIVENEFSNETNKSFEDIFLFGFGFLKIKIYSEFRGTTSGYKMFVNVCFFNKNILHWTYRDTYYRKFYYNT